MGVGCEEETEQRGCIAKKPAKVGAAPAADVETNIHVFRW